jgi:serralysin
MKKFFSDIDWQAADRDIAMPSLMAGTALTAPSYFKGTYALQIDGVGDRLPVFAPKLLATVDTVPDSPNMAPALTVGGPHVISTIDTIGDRDFYSVTLTAGVHYQIGMYGYTGGPSLTPLPDSYVEIYDSTGTLVTSGDGGANTPMNTANSGFDVLLDFIPTTSGTFYVNARGFDNVPADGTNGDLVGDYEVFVQPAPPGGYVPYYDVDSPLYAIDWGTRVNKVNQSAANPDGNEGIRATGNAQGTPIVNPAVSAIAQAQGIDITGKNVITIYFAKAGEVVTSLEDPKSPGLPPVAVQTSDVAQFEHDAVMTALHEFEKVADVVYIEVQDLSLADFEYASYKGTPGPGVSLLGSMSPPDEPNEGLALFNSGDSRWNALNLQQGGFSFVTLIHEIGHGHGLAHPHDNGGRSGIMRGVVPEGAGVADYTTGDFALNQGVFTMMSYEDGWQSSPYGNAATNVGYGYMGSLSPFDIAAIQDKYGVNEDWATGDDTYTLKDVNAAGTFFSAIWDNGGNDTIAYQGSRDATIDLRAATLQYETGGGGSMSFATGIFGGFTIANTVVIENATGGEGNDTIIGNAANNVLTGNGGNDVFTPGAGHDTVAGGAGNDGAYFGASFEAGDLFDGGAGDDQIGLQGNYANFALTPANIVNVEQIVFLSGSDTRFGDTAGNTYSYSLVSNDANVAAGQVLKVNGNGLGSGEAMSFDGRAETDGAFLAYGGLGTDRVTGGQQADGFYFGDTRWGASDVLDGQGGSDQLGLQGNYSGANAIVFGGGQLSSIEQIVLLSGADTRFGGGALAFNYTLTMNDANLATGQTMTINGNSLRSGEVLTFDGSAETGGLYRVFSGAGDDSIKGGAGNDTIYGGAGADTLTGGLGNDTFAYAATGHSTSGGFDTITDFALGDRIDLSLIDANSAAANNNAFAFIGANAFSHAAGELRATDAGNGDWVVEGDVDGDGVADIVIHVHVTDGHGVGGGDFVL